MAVLVTGGTGFTGANIVRELAERGNDVVSLDIVPPDDMVQRYLAPWAKQVTWLTGDIVSGADLEAVSAYERVESIVHAATYTPYGDTEKRNGRRVCDINLEGTLNVLDLARRLEVKRFMYISSAAVYQGQATPGEPLKEDMPLRLEGYSSESLWVLRHHQAGQRAPYPEVRVPLRVRGRKHTHVAELGSHREGVTLSYPCVLAQRVDGQSGPWRAYRGLTLRKRDY